MTMVSSPATVHPFRFLRIGPGGWNCACCAPPPGRRKQMFRRAKHVFKRDALAAGLQDYEQEVLDNEKERAETEALDRECQDDGL